MSTPGPAESRTRSASLLTRVDELLEHAERLARTAVSVNEYYSQVLGELADILEANGVAVWSVRDDGVSLFFDTNVDSRWDWGTRAVEPVSRLEPDRTVIVPPGVGGRFPNVTEFVRCLACQSVAPSLRLALDVRLPQETQCGENVADVVSAVTAVVVEFHRGRQLVRLMSLVTDRDRLASLCYSLHTSLDQKRIALELANDGASALQVDRVSVLLVRRAEFQLEAATAVSELNRRANASRAIEQLVVEIRRLGKSLLWTVASDEATDDIATQIARRYLQDTGARRVRVEPLGPRHGSWDAASAVVVFESFETESPSSEFDGIPEVCRHAAAAFGNAATLETQRVSGWIRQWKAVAASHRARTIAGLVFGLLVMLVVLPANLELEAHGQVQPERRRQVFAPTDGVITQVPVSNAKVVAENEVLVVLRNQELDLEEQRIRGEIATSASRLASVRAARVDHDRRSPIAISSGQLAAEEEEIKQAINSLNRQLEIVKQRIGELTLRSPIAGQVVRWDLIRSLEARPVRQGQLLMQVIDTQGPWQLELRIPDRAVRHVLAAQAARQEGLGVRFLFRMAPNVTYSAKLGTLNLATDLDQDGELSTLATVPLNPVEIPDLRPGSSVIAKIQCGRRSLGYVWLREFIEFLQTRLLF